MSHTLQFLLTKYGLLLTTNQVAEAIGLSQKTIFNRVYANDFPIPITRIGGHGKPMFRAQDVAAVVDGEPIPTAAPAKKKAGRKSNAEKAVASGVSHV